MTPPGTEKPHLDRTGMEEEKGQWVQSDRERRKPIALDNDSDR